MWLKILFTYWKSCFVCASSSVPLFFYYGTWSTLNTMFSVTYYLEFHKATSFYYWCNFFKKKFLMFSNTQTTNLMIASKI